MSLHDEWAAKIDEKLREPDTYPVYADLLKQMNAGEFDPYVEIVTQRWRGRYDIYDAYTFGQIHSLIMEREIAVRKIELGEVPSEDAAIEANCQKLAKLPAPFTGTFWGGKADHDGLISWDAGFHAAQPPIEWAPGSAPLEVGYTKPATSFRHLWIERALARWPYGSTAIWLLQWQQEPWNARRSRLLLSVTKPASR